MLALEFMGPGLLFFFSFAISALISAGAHYFGINFQLQIAVFLISSIIIIFILKRLVRPSGKIEGYQSNVAALIGKRGIVTAELGENVKGFIKINGEIWSSREEKNRLVKKGTLIEVIKVIGCHLVVKIVKD